MFFPNIFCFTFFYILLHVVAFFCVGFRNTKKANVIKKKCKKL